MGIGFQSTIPYSVRRQYAPVYASTVADSTTFTGVTCGDAYTIQLQCISGSIAYSVTNTTPSASVGNQIIARDSNLILVRKTDYNPTATLSIIGLSTTSAYQAWVMG